ncbi:molybdopterin oxidoreductase [Pengzhenrongella sp.]|jgi:hypothetical protein
MTIHTARQTHRRISPPEWWTVAAWASLGLLVISGLAGAVGLG